MGKQKDIIMLSILNPRILFWNQIEALAFGYKMVLEPTKTDQYEQIYDRMKLTTQIVTWLFFKKIGPLVTFFLTYGTINCKKWKIKFGPKKKETHF